ncbi:hypothetical protein AGLY_002641 [Aphis glycines]|uniref:Uncharacterized protein n=1 Tax=Aphis glycines TaxID=307491 RepID=A0A6G0U1S0_APHGL|nr:hypothetical protein AGLY_002641 [Aphis glycines]
MWFQCIQICLFAEIFAITAMYMCIKINYSFVFTFLNLCCCCCCCCWFFFFVYQSVFDRVLNRKTETDLQGYLRRICRSNHRLRLRHHHRRLHYRNSGLQGLLWQRYQKSIRKRQSPDQRHHWRRLRWLVVVRHLLPLRRHHRRRRRHHRLPLPRRRHRHHLRRLRHHHRRHHHRPRLWTLPAQRRQVQTAEPPEPIRKQGLVVRQTFRRTAFRCLATWPPVYRLSRVRLRLRYGVLVPVRMSS